MDPEHYILSGSRCVAARHVLPTIAMPDMTGSLMTGPFSTTISSRLALIPCPIRFPYVVRHEVFELRLSLLVLEVGLSGSSNENSAQAFEELLSNDPHRLDVGARRLGDCTQRQFLSAVKRRC